MAYVTATLVAKDVPLEDGRVRITVEFTGNAGEPAKRLTYLVGSADTLQSIRRWAISQAAGLGTVKTVADGLTVGQSVSLAAITPPAATAQEIWNGKLERYKRLAGLGLVGQTATDLAALKADIEATYLSAYL